MSIKILCIGDVVGRPGRYVVSQRLGELVSSHGVCCTIVNVENASGGSGLTETLYGKFLRYGVDLMTMGDHVYRQREIISVLERSDRIVRPANLPPQAPGKEFAVYKTASGVQVAVISLLGRLFMKMGVDCPFRTVDRVLEALPKDVKIIVVDMHAEATSEKIAMGWHLDGRVSLVFGTHTHVATADERILPRGTAYITDVGMTGPHDSVLGRRKEQVLRALITSVPVPFEVADVDNQLHGVVVEVMESTGRALSIQRITAKAEAPADG